MERVKIGEKYWFIDFSGIYVVDWLTEFYDEENTTHFLTKNYFHTEEEANQILKKIRAVLAGADVIEMPSEEEIRKHYTEMMISNPDYHLRTSAVVHINVIDWLKSKIVK